MARGIKDQHIDPQRCTCCYRDRHEDLQEEIVKQGRYYYHASCLAQLELNPLKKELLLKLLNEYYDDWWWTLDNIREVGQNIEENEIIEKYDIEVSEDAIWIYFLAGDSAGFMELPYAMRSGKSDFINIELYRKIQARYAEAK